MPLRTDVGAMKRRAILQRPSGGAGFETVAIVPGARQLLSAATIETMQNGAPTAVTQWRWMFRYRTDLKSEWRIEDADDGRVFQIHGFGEPEDVRDRIYVFCSELQ